MVATCAFSFGSDRPRESSERVDGRPRPRSSPRFRSIGARAGGDVARPRRRSRARAGWTWSCRRPTASPVCVGRLAQHLRAEVLVGSSRSISLAMVTPSLQTSGAPHFFSMHALATSGRASPARHRPGVSMPRSILSRASTENLTSLAAISDSSVHISPQGDDQGREFER